MTSVVHDPADTVGKAVGPVRGGDVAATSTTGPITDLLYKAVENKTPVAELRELVSLHKEMHALQAAQDFNVAMAHFQAVCPPIKKSSTAKVTSRRAGTTFSYTYAELDEIARTINPILTKYGLSYTWDTSVKDGQLTCICHARHLGGHVVTSTFSLPIENESAMSPQQMVGAAATFAKRQSLTAVFGLTTTDDDPEAVELANPERITEDQLTLLEDFAREVGVNYERFLAYLRIQKLADLRAVDYEKALAALEARKATLSANKRGPQ